MENCSVNTLTVCWCIVVMIIYIVGSMLTCKTGEISMQLKG